MKYAKHSLGKVNRKFIFIPHKKIFVPLYYDGMVEFPIGKTNCSIKSNEKIFEKFSNEYNKLSKKNLSKMERCVFYEVFSLYENQNIATVKKQPINLTIVLFKQW